MAKAKKKRSPKDVIRSGRITLKPCPTRTSDDGGEEEEWYCAPLDHIEIEGKKPYWACSCGRRYSAKVYKQFLKDHPDWTEWPDWTDTSDGFPTTEGGGL